MMLLDAVIRCILCDGEVHEATNFVQSADGLFLNHLLGLAHRTLTLPFNDLRTSVNEGRESAMVWTLPFVVQRH
jgi:hypothetical protein